MERRGHGHESSHHHRIHHRPHHRHHSASYHHRDSGRDSSGSSGGERSSRVPNDHYYDRHHYHHERTTNSIHNSQHRDSHREPHHRESHQHHQQQQPPPQTPHHYQQSHQHQQQVVKHHNHGVQPPLPKETAPPSGPPTPQKPRNYKLLVDPALVKNATKLYRYDGIVPGDPTFPTVQLRDPRSQLTRIWTRLEQLDLPVPRFKIDANYCGDPPPLEVTFNNLNDNIDKAFLSDMVHKFDTTEEITIFYHPVTNKHLGIARVVFETTKGAKACVEKLNKTSVMGKELKVVLDAFGKECRKLFEDLTTEKKKEEPIAPLPPVVPPTPAVRVSILVI